MISDREWDGDELARKAELEGLAPWELARVLAVDIADSLQSIAEHGNTDLALVACKVDAVSPCIIIATSAGEFVLHVRATEPTVADWERNLAIAQARARAEALANEGGGA